MCANLFPAFRRSRRSRRSYGDVGVGGDAGVVVGRLARYRSLTAGRHRRNRIWQGVAGTASKKSYSLLTIPDKYSFFRAYSFPEINPLCPVRLSHPIDRLG
jgi:hypothetical protein